MLFVQLSYSQLLVIGVHVGHSLANSSIYAAWMVTAFRQLLTIINLYKSLIMFRNSFLLLTNLVHKQAPVWFINLDASTDRYIKYAAFNCGEWPISIRWIRGSISNYKLIFNAYRRLRRLSSLGYSPKKKRFADFFSTWYLTRYSWPRGVFISSLHNSYFAAKEAFNLKIPAMAIVDTNAWAQVASVAIPGNDESVECIVFYNDLISSFILSRKFGLISTWFYYIRNIPRVVNISEWFESKNNFTHKIDLKPVLTFESKTIPLILRSARLFFSKNNFIKNTQDFISVKTDYFTPKFHLDVYNAYTDRQFRLKCCVDFHFIQKLFRFRRVAFKKTVFTQRNFKLRFLTKKYYYKKYLRGWYFKNTLRRREFYRRFLARITTLYFYKKYAKVRRVRKVIPSEVAYLNYFSDLLGSRLKSRTRIGHIDNIFLRISKLKRYTSFDVRVRKTKPAKNKWVRNGVLRRLTRWGIYERDLRWKWFRFLKRRKGLSFWSYQSRLIFNLNLFKNLRSKKLKFCFGNIFLDVPLPHNAMIWNVQFFFPKSSVMRPELEGFFYRKPHSIKYTNIQPPLYLFDAISPLSFNKHIKVPTVMDVITAIEEPHLKPPFKRWSRYLKLYHYAYFLEPTKVTWVWF